MTGREGKHAPAVGPWKLAFRRLRRNKTAIGFLVLFIVLVVMCLLAPIYSKDIAHIGPNTNNITGTINVGGKQTEHRLARRRANRAHLHQPLLLRG